MFCNGNEEIDNNNRHDSVFSLISNYGNSLSTKELLFYDKDKLSDFDYQQKVEKLYLGEE